MNSFNAIIDRPRGFGNVIAVWSGSICQNFKSKSEINVYAKFVFHFVNRVTLFSKKTEKSTKIPRHVSCWPAHNRCRPWRGDSRSVRCNYSIFTGKHTDYLYHLDIIFPDSIIFHQFSKFQIRWLVAAQQFQYNCTA